LTARGEKKQIPDEPVVSVKLVKQYRAGKGRVTDKMAETLYILKSEANRKILQIAIDEMNSGVHYQHELIKD
jgi:hypothetical protein